MSSEQVVKISADAFNETIKEGVVLVDFWATWCGPCRMLGPVVDRVAEELREDQVTVAKYDIDEGKVVATDLNITSIPTIIVFKDGVEVERLHGATHRQAELVALCKKHI